MVQQAILLQISQLILFGGKAETRWRILEKDSFVQEYNEYLVQKLDLFVDYSTKGSVKHTHLDKSDSPVFLEVDKNHLQQVNYPITLLPKGNGKYEVVLPKRGTF